MEKGLAFWIIYLVCVVLGLYFDWPADGKFRSLGGRVVLFILIGILGWAVFGAPIK